MQKRVKTLRIISLLMFSIGILAGMAVGGGIIWSDLEASLFDSSIGAKSSLRLSCPVAITTHEVGKVSATLKNSTDKEKNFYVRAHISEGYVSLKREVNQQIPVAPGEKEKVSWEIYPDDAAYNRIILFRAYVNPSYPIPSQGNFCGVLVIDIPALTGTQFFILMLGLSLAGIIGGSAMWQKIHRPMTEYIRSMTNALNALAVIIFGAILSGYLGIWILGILLFATSILMMGVIIGRYIPSI